MQQFIMRGFWLFAGTLSGLLVETQTAILSSPLLSRFYCLLQVDAGFLQTDTKVGQKEEILRPHTRYQFLAELRAVLKPCLSKQQPAERLCSTAP